MDQLERDGDLHGVVAAVGAGRAGGGVKAERDHEGTDALTAGADEVERDLGETRFAGREFLTEAFLDPP
jgi:hypothetical protein